MTDETKAVVPYQNPEVVKPEREPVRNIELREERRQQHREEHYHDRDVEVEEPRRRKRSGIKRFLRKGVNMTAMGNMAQRSQENARHELSFGEGILDHNRVSFSSYADPFSFGSMRSGTGLQWGNADPFRSINWMSGTPGRKGLFDLQGGVFASTSGLKLGRSIFGNNDTPRKKKRRPRRR